MLTSSFHRVRRFLAVLLIVQLFSVYLPYDSSCRGEDGGEKMQIKFNAKRTQFEVYCPPDPCQPLTVQPRAPVNRLNRPEIPSSPGYSSPGYSSPGYSSPGYSPSTRPDSSRLLPSDGFASGPSPSGTSFGSPPQTTGAPFDVPQQQVPSGMAPPPAFGADATPFSMSTGNSLGDSVASPAQSDPGPGPASGLSSSQLAAVGVGFDTDSADDPLPNVLGDFLGGGFGGATIVQTQSFQNYLPGFVVSGTPGSPTSTLVFESTTPLTPDDIFTVGAGQDVAGGDGVADTFDLDEPLFPSDILTNPGNGYVFDGGNAVFVGNNVDTTAQPGAYANGDLWFLSYSFSETIAGGTNGNGTPRIIAGPGAASRRVKIAENFAPDVRNRLFLNHSYFSDVVGGIGIVNRTVLGLENTFGFENVSVELRLPLARTLANVQDLDAEQDRDNIVGNGTVIFKSILARTNNFIWSAGLGLGLPLAGDTVLKRGGLKLIEIQNRAVHLLPYTGLFFRPTENLSFQSYLQFDVDTSGNRVFGDAVGADDLPQIGVFKDPLLLSWDISTSYRFFNRAPSRRSRCSLRDRFFNGFDGWEMTSAHATAELHYTSTLESADVVSGNGVTYSSFAPELDIWNCTLGAQVWLSNRLRLAPGVSLPLSGGTNRQFDYEGIFQASMYF